MWAVRREIGENPFTGSPYTKFMLTDSETKAYEGGPSSIKVNDKEDAMVKLKAIYDKHLSPGYSVVVRVFDGWFLLETPIFLPNNEDDLRKEVIKKGMVFVTNPWDHCQVVEDEESFVATKVRISPSCIYKVEFSPSKARAKKRAPQYRKTTKMRYGRIPLYWFQRYANIIHRAVDLPMLWSYGWGTWDGANYSYTRVHPRVKERYLTDLRLKTEWYNLVKEASGYIEGAEIHQKDNFRSKWASDMRLECTVLDIPIPTYKKGAKDGQQSPCASSA